MEEGKDFCFIKGGHDYDLMYSSRNGHLRFTNVIDGLLKTSDYENYPEALESLRELPEDIRYKMLQRYITGKRYGIKKGSEISRILGFKNPRSVVRKMRDDTFGKRIKISEPAGRIRHIRSITLPGWAHKQLEDHLLQNELREYRAENLRNELLE